jgi:hypothetical protein
MRCCPTCFGDRGLERNIFPTLPTEIGRCDFCNSDNMPLVEPKLLGDIFGLLKNIYEPDAHGLLLVEWFKKDWRLFDHERMDVARAQVLLGEILDDGEAARQRFSPSAKYTSDALARWEALRDELMYENRYFPSSQLDRDRFDWLLGQVRALNLPTTWYRARLQSDDALFPIEEMGPPPKRMAAHGRANPSGIPYLYVGSTPKTAISEIRPHTGDKACVADFTTPPTEELHAVDVREPRKLVSPFILGDEETIGRLRADIDFLERLGEELTRPVLPQGAAIDYVPSQYICELIKKSGYKGVVYRSSVGDGMNLALFDPGLATGGQVRSYRVIRVTVDIEAA